MISGRFDGFRIPAANRRVFRNSPEGNGCRVEDLTWMSTKNRGIRMGFLISWVLGRAKNTGSKKSRGWTSYFLCFWSCPKPRQQEIQNWISYFLGFWSGQKLMELRNPGAGFLICLVFMSPGGLRCKSARLSEVARSCAVLAAQGGALHLPKGEAEAVEDQ